MVHRQSRAAYLLESRNILQYLVECRGGKNPEKKYELNEEKGMLE